MSPNLSHIFGDNSATNSGPKKRREEKRKEPPNPPAGGGGAKPPPFDPLAVQLPHPSPAFAAAWAEWVKHRAEKKGGALTPTSVGKQLGTLAQLVEPQAIACIEHSIRNGWLGLFPDDFRGGKRPERRGPMTAGEREMRDLETHLGGILDE